MGTSARAPVEVSFQTTGVDEVRRGIRVVRDDVGDLESSSEGLGEKFAMASRHMAMGLEEVSHSGEVAGRGMKQLITTGAEMALSFGPGGPLVAAVGILGLAFVDHFMRAREEIKKTEEQFEDSLKQMINAGNNAALMKQAEDLFRGTPFEHFQDGIAALERQLAPLKAERAKLEASGMSPFYAPMGPGGQAAPTALGQVIQQIGAIDEKLDPVKKNFEELRQAILDVNNTPLDIRGLPTVTTRENAPGKSQPNQRFVDIGRGPTDEQLGKDLAELLGRTTLESLVAKETKGSIARLGGQPGSELSKDVAEEAKRLGDAFGESFKQTENRAKEVTDHLRAQLADGLAGAITSGIDAGIRALFTSGGNLGKAFAALGRSAIASLGAMVEEFGVNALKTAILANTVLRSIFTPAGIPAALALIALGATMQAVGGGGRSGGMASSVGGYSSSLPQIIDRGYINPSAAARGANVTPMQPVTVNATIIGKNDPGVGPALVGIIDSAIGKGVIRRNSWGNG